MNEQSNKDKAQSVAANNCLIGDEEMVKLVAYLKPKVLARPISPEANEKNEPNEYES